MRERIVTHTAQRTVFSRNRSKAPRLEGGAARRVGDFKDVDDVTESRRFADGDASLPSHTSGHVSALTPRIAPIGGISGDAGPPRSRRR
jgi:hypothetical protein